MPKLDHATYKQRCLTCLKKVSIDANDAILIESLWTASGSSIAFSDNNIKSDNENRKYINKTLARCLDKSQLDLELELDMDLPRLLCIECYGKLQSFEDFRCRACYSYDKLWTLVNGQLLEIEYNEMLKDESNSQTDELDSVLLKNSLFETESVLLESSNIIYSGQHLWDPFEKALPQQTVEESNVCLESVDIEKEDLTLKPSENILTLDSKEEVHLEEINSSISLNNKGRRADFKCKQCNLGFAKKFTLDAHVRKFHEGLKRPFKCDRCDKSYSFIGGLNTHIQEIHEAKVRSYPCDYDGCTNIYTSFVAMKKHKRLKHKAATAPPEKKFVCEHCGDIFNQSGNLNIHRRTKHPTGDEEKSAKKDFYCDICQKEFKSSYTLHYHKLRLHQTVDGEGNSSKYECKVCGRKMAKKFMLVQHMNIHSNEKTPCEHCGKKFLRKFELESHIRAVHMKLKPFACSSCPASFASRRTLRHHEYIHTGEKPYVCDICNHAFRQQTCLKNHRKTHYKFSAKEENLTTTRTEDTSAIKMASSFTEEALVQDSLVINQGSR